MPPIQLLPHALPEMFAQVTATGKLTLADRYAIKAAVLDDSLAEEDRQAIDRLIYACKKGRVQMVDEFSILSLGIN